MLRRHVARASGESDSSGTRRLPGNACFLEDGRVLCRPRELGDSRYPYGRDGFNFWVYASGRMHANNGAYFVLLPFHAGQEPSVAFFAGMRDAADGSYTPISLLPVPYIGQSEPRVTRCAILGPDAAYFMTDTQELRAMVRVFVTQVRPEHVHIAFSLHLENASASPRDFFTSAYVNPFCRHQFVETSEDPWFKKVEILQETQATALPPFLVSVNEDVSRFRSITNHALMRRSAMVAGRPATSEFEAEVCTSRLAYMGDPRIDLGQAGCLRLGWFARQVRTTVFNDVAVAADLIRFRLAPGDTARFDYVLSLPGDDALLALERERPVNAAQVDAALASLRGRLRQVPHDLDMQVSEGTDRNLDADVFNRFLPYLRTQVRVCAEVNGYMQPSPNSLIGIRDVFQAIEGHMYDQPDGARRKMQEALEYVLVDGRCPRQYSLPHNGVPGPADLREFVDQGLWVISTVYAYVCLTGDAAFLSETLGYHQIDPADRSRMAPAADRDSVLDHLFRIMDYLDRSRDPQTGLLRALYGDWNDALDGLGTTQDAAREFGTGVSVMASLQLYQAGGELLALLKRYSDGQHPRRVQALVNLRSELENGLLRHAVVRQGTQRRIVHGWGDLRQYDVGSFCDSDGQARDGLTSNAFWVLSGLLDRRPDLRGDILAAMERLDSPFGLKTFEPGFAPDAPGVGRIPKLPIGTAENGATYVHATLFGIGALFLMGEPRKAWEQLMKILPFTPGHDGLSHSPFVMPNSYVYNPALNLTGQNMNDWQTGSSNVLLKILIRYVFGFQPELDGLCVAPASWSPFHSLRFAAQAQGRRVRIEITRDNTSARRFRLNGVDLPVSADAQTSIPAVFIPYEELRGDAENRIEVVDPLADAAEVPDGMLPDAVVIPLR
ncbi:MAG: hypothetical protein JXB13_01675 [Phycisphaerae bacterium]|nr:hypothetical protein [Phycisphaerae bacterium]